MALAASMAAGRRRLLYGANVALAALLALVLVGIALWAAERFGGRLDLTRRGVNSLSSRTVRLLEGLKQPITISGLYTVLSKYQQYAQKRQDRVRDLLDLYEAFGRGRITAQMIDPMKQQGELAGLLKRLRDKPVYKDEAKPHAEALDSFPALNAEISRLAESDFNQLKQFAQADGRLRRVREFVIVANGLARVHAEAQAVAGELDELLGGEIARYGRAVKQARDYLTRARAHLQDAQGWMGGGGQSLPELSPQVQAFFRDAAGRYRPLLQRADAWLSRTEKLKDVELEKLYDRLSRWATSPPILVENQREARVLSMEDVWPYRAPNEPAPPDGDPRDFAGEQAISSAILQLTQGQKTAIVFTRCGGPSPIHPDFSRLNRMMMQLPRAPYQALNGLLEKDNFVTADWDVSKQETPPEVEDAARRIYVVFPPRPPPQPNPMEPAPRAGITPAQKQAVIDAVNAAGLAIFLTGWSQPTTRFALSGPPYAFADYLKSKWGIEVQENYLALEFTEVPQRRGLAAPANRNPLLLDTDAVRFSDHQITRPLRALEGAFHAVAPLKVHAGQDRPAGVEVAVLAEAADTEDVWAVSDINRLQQDLQQKFGTRRYPADVPAPFPVALAASNDQGQKLVVFASERFAADDIARSQSFVFSGNGLQAYLNYPANSDLFVNACHWLSGEANRIAVGPRQADVPRLDRLTPGGLEVFCRVFLVGIWPGLALLAGAGVWLLRRR